MGIAFTSWSDNAAPHFVELVNRLLPTGVHFTINPMPRNRSGEGLGSITGAPSGPAPGNLPWKRNFASMLRTHLAPASPRVAMRLVENDRYQVLVGQFADACLQFAGHTIDVADIAALPEEFAGMAIMHELEEQRQAQVLHRRYDDAHPPAIRAELSLTGMTRVKGLRSGGPDRADVCDVSPRRGSWNWWIAYTRPGYIVESLMLRLVDFEITEATLRLPRFPTVAEFERIARREGLTVEF